MTTATLEDPATETQTSFKTAFLQVAIRRSRPSFTTKVTASRLKRAGIDATYKVGDSEISTDGPTEQRAEPVTRLLPDSLHKLLNTAYNRFTSYVEDPTRSRPHPSISGLYIIPADRGDEFFSGLAVVKERFATDLEEFFDRYDEEYVQPTIEYWSTIYPPQLFNMVIKPHIPPIIELRRKMGARVIPVVMDYADVNDAAAALTDLAAGIRDDLSTALEAAREKLESGKIVSAGSFNDLRRVLATARAFSDVLDPNLIAETGKLDSLVAQVAKDASEKSAGESQTSIFKDRASMIAAATLNVIEAITDIDDRPMLERFGCSPRKFM